MTPNSASAAESPRPSPVDVLDMPFRSDFFPCLPQGHRPKTSAAPTRPLSGPQLRLKSDGSGLANASKGEVEAVAKLTRPPSRGRGPSQLSAGIRHNAAEDFPELPPKGQGAYDVDILGINSDSEFDG